MITSLPSSNLVKGMLKNEYELMLRESFVRKLVSDYKFTSYYCSEAAGKGAQLVTLLASVKINTKEE